MYTTGEVKQMAVDSYTFMKLSTHIRLGYAQNMMRHETSVPNKRLIKIAEVVVPKQRNENIVKDYLKEIKNAKIIEKKAELENIESIKKHKRHLKKIREREIREKEQLRIYTGLRRAGYMFSHDL